jgi:tetratricopeptide (TPR) repeat protein
MYTQILKEILLTIDFQQQHIDEFLHYCREQFFDSTTEMKNIDMIEKDYHRHPPIWWYTHPCFLYSMLNRALRTMEADLIIKMGFFVRDLHGHIATLHSEQYGGHYHSNSFTVYRGQGLSLTDFDQLNSTQGRLLSFNNLLSTSLNRDISLAFAEAAIDNSDLMGILFEINIDPSISSTSFANVKNVSYFQEEEEILFSMHSVFRIGQIKQIDEENNRLWQAELTLTDDHDSQLQELTKSIQEDTGGPTGWFRLARLMMKIAQFDKAQQVFEMILDRTTDEKEKGHIYHDLGLIKMNQGKYTEAITYIEKSLKIRQKTLPANHFTFSTSRDNSDLMNVTTDDCRSAIASFEEAAEMLKQTLPEDDPSLAEFYDRCGSACQKMGNDEEALSFYDRALRLRQIQLPPNHPSLAASYANYGDIHESMGDSSTAHSCLQRAFDIAQRSLPVNHPDRERYRERIENKVQES